MRVRVRERVMSEDWYAQRAGRKFGSLREAEGQRLIEGRPGEGQRGSREGS